MKIPAELMDWDRQPEYADVARAVSNYWERATKARPMGAGQKRIPSPYTNVEPPRPIKRESDTAMVAFCCFATMGTLVTLVGITTIARWVWEAVR